MLQRYDTNQNKQNKSQQSVLSLFNKFTGFSQNDSNYLFFNAYYFSQNRREIKTGFNACSA
jgi:hypothetical protein